MIYSLRDFQTGKITRNYKHLIFFKYVTFSLMYEENKVT